MSDWRIPLSDLDYGEEENEAVKRVLGTRWLSTGPEVEAFEQEFASFLEGGQAIAVANGTAALHLALLATVRRGDAVLQPAINFVAAANMTLAVGARPASPISSTSASRVSIPWRLSAFSRGTRRRWWQCITGEPPPAWPS